MVSYELGRGETKDFRCPSTALQYKNRIANRVTMKAYGRSIIFFESRLQLLFAVRDAIAGHRRIGGKDIRILHRDISHNNILLGKDGAPEGDRGVLIDLDIAFKATDDEPMTPASYHLGTRLFQSRYVLRTREPSLTPQMHDYLDDLESFFYLLCYVFLSFRPDGHRLPSDDPGPQILMGWTDDKPAGTAGSNKGALYGLSGSGAAAPQLIERVWGTVCAVLFLKFRRWLVGMIDEKTKIRLAARRQGGRRPGPTVSLESLHSHRVEHYNHVLKILDEAINKIKPPTAFASAIPHRPHPAPVIRPLPANRVCQISAPPENHSKSPVSSSSSTSVALVARAPAPTTPPKVPVESAPSIPSRKRASDDETHPRAPSSKTQRICVGNLTTRSP